MSNHVITGASSDVGRLLARRAEPLHALAEALRRDGCPATALP